MPSPLSKRSRRIADLKKFLFVLETLLQYRENIEQKERDELSRLFYKYQLELNNRDALAARRQETVLELATKQSENVAQKELIWFFLYLDRLSHEREECEKRILQLDSEIQTQKQVVIEASKKRKTLASMKAKKAKEHAVAADKQEQKDVDELVVTRFATKET
jgi:flagellar FliJ protein